MGFTSLAAKQVCLEQVKRAQVVQIFLQKVELLSTFRNRQQADLLQDRFDAWVVKQATSL